MSAKVVKLIYCDSECAGKGTEDDPIRVLKQFFTLDGRMIFQYDSHLCVNTVPKTGNGGTLVTLDPSIAAEASR
jgi:hypothetical protein